MWGACAFILWQSLLCSLFLPFCQIWVQIFHFIAKTVLGNFMFTTCIFPFLFFLPSRLYFNLVIVAFCPHQTSSSPDVWILEHQVISIKLVGLTLAHESSRGRTCCVHIQKGRAPWSLPAASRWWGCSLVMPWHLLRLTWFLDFTGSLSSFPSGKRQGLNPFSEYLVKIFVTFSFVCDTHVSQNLCSLLFYVHK